MKKVLTRLVFTVCLMQSIVALAQGGRPFFNEIQAFKKADSIQQPPQDAILFVGSSSFRMWTDVQQNFPSHTIINRGFGGSTLVDLIGYENELIFKYHPKQIVIYSGENDLASSDTVTSAMVFERFKKLFTDISAKLPDVPIVYVSLKPSPSRERLMLKMVEANLFIESFIKKNKKIVFVDVYHSMLNAEGHPIEEIFKADKLHMNEKGYAIWQKKIMPYLKN
jgi:lysophospholipase L1-like esterase